MNLRILARAFPCLLLALCACDKVHKKLAEMDYNQGVKDYEAGDTAGASNDFSRAIIQNPNFSDAYIYRAIIRHEARDYPLAIQDYQKAIAIDPQEALAYVDLAISLEALGKWEDAITNYSEAIKLDAKSSEPYVARGRARMQLKEYELAMSDLDAAVELDSNDAEAFAVRGQIKETKGDVEAAKLDLATAMKLEPTNLTAMAIMTNLKWKSDDLPGALAIHLKAIQYARKSPEAFQFLGAMQYNSSQYAEALKSFRKAIELDEKNYYSRFWIWMICTRAGERDKGTRELSDNLKGRGNDSEHAWELCIGRFLIGDLSESNLVAQAEKTANRLTDVAGQQCEAHYYAGMKNLLEGNKPGAIDHFKKCIATGVENYTEYLSAKTELRKVEEKLEHP